MTVVIQKTQQEKILWLLSVLLIIGLVLFWYSHHKLQAKWVNVPNPPTHIGALMSGIGDPLFAYRSYGIILQNMGDMGGRVTNLKDYNYEYLGAWFKLLHKLDPQSNFIPFVASYYYGGLDKETERLRPVIEYLAMAGNSPEGQKWRWLAQAAYLARFQMDDLDFALKLSDDLAKVENPKMPAWARQMKASILNAQGEKEASATMLLGILENGIETMHPNEVNATVAYLCEQVLTKDQISEFDLCQGDY